VCVLLTSVSALELGYLVSVIKDCCADYIEVHNGILRRYKDWALEIIEKHNDIEHKYKEWMEQIEKLNQINKALAKRK